jgi:hypothetical protein
MRTKIGECSVDAGMLMIGDPCYFVGKDAIINEKCADWKQACKEVFCVEGEEFDRDKPYDVYGLGVAISTTYGDGCYPVYLKTDINGRRRVIVELD